MSRLLGGWSRRAGGLAAAVVLVVAANAGYLARVGFERAGEPQAVMELTARELQPERVWNEEDSSRALGVRWQPGERVDEDELAGLGFGLEACREGRTGEREVWGAFDLAGEGWSAWLEEEIERLEEDLATARTQGGCCIEEKEEEIARLAERASRLVLVAVDADRGVLADRYAARREVAVVPLLVSCLFDYGNDARPLPLVGGVRWKVGEVHVPAARRGPVDRLARWLGSEVHRGRSVGDEGSPDYVATVSFGRRGIARLVAVEALTD